MGYIPTVQNFIGRNYDVLNPLELRVPLNYPHFQTNPDVIQITHHVEVAYPTTPPLRLIVLYCFYTPIHVG